MRAKMQQILNRLEQHLKNFDLQKNPNDARKILECNCKLLLKNAGVSQDEYDGKLAQGLIDYLTIERLRISKTQLKKLKTELNFINTYGSIESHDSEEFLIESDIDKLSESILNLMDFIFNSEYIQIDERIPDYICIKYKNITSHLENWRCDKIIKSVYPNRNFEILINSNGYSLYEVKEPDGRKLAFLFFGRNVGFTSSFEEIRDKVNLNIFNSFTILYPNEISKITKKPVLNRTRYIEQLSSKILNESGKIFIKCDFIENYIWDQCLPQQYKQISNITTEKYFIDQVLLDANKNSILTQELVKKLISNTKDDIQPIYLILGSGGAGKTTFCEQSIKAIDHLTEKGIKKKAILLSSYDIPENIPDNKNIENIHDLFYLIKTDTDHINNYSLELNISSGNLLIVIDGLDEIISKLKDNFNLEKFITSILSLNDTYLNSNVIITSRDLSGFVDESILSEIYTLSLQGFDEKLSEEYFNKRFRQHENVDELVKKGLRYLSKINIKSNPTPLILALIGDLILDGDDSIIDEDTEYFIKDNPLDLIIYQMIQRDIEKQNLLISIDNYFEIIRDMIIEYGGKVDSNQLTEIIDMSIENNQESQYSAFFVSPLLSKRGEFFYLKYDALDFWFKTRVLLNLLKGNKKFNKNYLSIIYTSNSYLGGDVVSEIDNFEIDIKTLNYNIKRIISDLSLNNIEEIDKKIISGLLYIFAKKNNYSDKESLSAGLKEILPESMGKFSGLNIYGDFYPLDFNDFNIKDSSFVSYNNLAKCIFPIPHRKVFFNCFFSKLDHKIFSSSTLTEDLFSDCNLDYTVGKIFENDSVKSLNKIENIKYDLNKIFKCGYKDGAFSWKSILVYKQQCNSLKTNKKLDRWLELLVEHNILVKEQSKSSSEKGYVVNIEYSQDVKNFLTQKRLSPILKSIISDL